MKYTYLDVLAEISALEYLLPEPEKLTAALRERKFTPVEVAPQKYADFVAGNLDAFLRYLRVNHIRSVMYSYLYYTEAEMNDLFTLEDSDKTLFRNRIGSGIDGRGCYGSARRSQFYAESDYGSYLQYSRFIRASLDLSHPKELRLYALHQGRIVACQLADAWMLRLNLISRPALRRMAASENLGKGCLQFGFVAPAVWPDEADRIYYC